jgi:hypothetical protein
VTIKCRAAAHGFLLHCVVPLAHPSAIVRRSSSPVFAAAFVARHQIQRVFIVVLRSVLLRKVLAVPRG